MKLAISGRYPIGITGDIAKALGEEMKKHMEAYGFINVSVEVSSDAPLAAKDIGTSTYGTR
jgi:hypothetical protein